MRERTSTQAAILLTRQRPFLPPKQIQTFVLRFVFGCVSLRLVKQSQTIRKRDRLAARLPDAGYVLRGSLLERVIRHRTGVCPKCDRGEGHPVAVLAVGY